jgi:uncharacterized membrane protein
MQEENKKTSSEDSFYFLMATLCALPFVAMWCIKLFSSTLWSKIVFLVIYGCPLLIIIGIVGVVCSVYTIKKLPALEAWGYCYIIIIVLYIASLIGDLMSFSGSGP